MKQVKSMIPVRLLTLLLGLFLSVNAFAQQIAVKGNVKDATGEPIIGANVRIDGQTNAGTVTDIDGNFSINAPQGSTLSITYIGYKTAKVNAAANVTVTMTEDDKTLNEVVVIGYGVVKKSDLTGSVTALKPDTKNKGVVVNPQDMLEGKIAGVNVVSNDGAPGGGSTIRIRGGSSLNATNDPLIVIDGLAMDNEGVKGLSNPLSMINPQDIESFNVLKDASATAIYGSRGSNGVIIITTKKGRKNQAPQVSYSGSFTVSMKKNDIDVMDGDEYRAFIKNLYGESSDAYSALGTANTDWQSEIYRTAYSQDHNVTVSGAIKKLPYRFSVGYTDQQGIVKTSDFKRVTASFNFNPSFLDDHLTLNINGKGMYAKSIYPNTGDAISAAVWMDPTQDPYSYTSAYHKALLGTGLDQTLKNFGGYFEWTSHGIDTDSSWPFTYNTNATKNPLAVLYENHDEAHSRSMVGSADIDYKVHGFEDLRLHATLGADISYGKQFTDDTSASPENTYYGSHGWETILKRNLSLSTYAQYYHDFDTQHHFDIMGGYEWQHFWRNQKKDYIGYYPSTSSVTPGEARPHTPYHYKTESYLVSFFGRANYTLMNRYFFTATVRDDGTSRFKDHWKWYPSFAFAWRVKDENKFRDIDWLSDLKLRLGWGMTGQQAGAIDDFGWIPKYSMSTGTNGYYPVTGTGVLYRPDNYTPNLKWETTTTYNVGLDWGILNQRLTGSVDWYFRKTTDLLNYAPLAVMMGYRNQAWQNIGNLTNTGVEVSFDWKAIQTKDLLWDIAYNFTANKNKITDLTGVSDSGSPVENTNFKIGTDKYFEYNQVGYPTNSFYVYQQVYDKSGNPIENCVVDRNGDGQITQDDRYLYKSPAPKVTMGLSSRLEWKNWDLGFNLRVSLGNYVFDQVDAGASNIGAASVWSNSLLYMANRPKSILGLNWQTYNEESQLSDYWVRNASFLKCDNITLGYSFNQLFKSGNWHGLSGRAYATANNVFTITNYDGLDPEIPTGYDNNLYPRPFSVIVGVNLNF
jgi:TonB-linked SusC/RagA family outer membrane protein